MVYSGGSGTLKTSTTCKLTSLIDNKGYFSFAVFPQLVKPDTLSLHAIKSDFGTATGIFALIFLPKSPHDTNRLVAGLVPVQGWLSEREADIFVARLVKADPQVQQSDTMKITIADM